MLGYSLSNNSFKDFDSMELQCNRMEFKVCFVILFYGCLIITEAGYMNPLRHYNSLHVTDEKKAEKINLQIEKSIEEAWQKRIIQDADPPSFYSEKFNSKITGKTMVTFLNRTVFAFQGFRFGKGERFKPPTPVDKFWDGDNFNAIHIGSKCPQHPMTGHQPAGREDCLYLNVYTPYLPPGDTLLPVMVFVHGGSFTAGDASYYMPTRLLDHEVILVTIHYRLGAFGFFTLNNEEAPGNIALYDQVEALRWVNRHIEEFGGDPEKVTVMGESAGSVSVNYLMIAEPAKGLFRAIIAESGSCLDPWGFDKDSTYAANYLAEDLGCNLGTDELILECMRNVSVPDLVRAESRLTSNDRHHGLVGFRGASPSVQNFTLSPDAYYKLMVDKPPIEYFKQRKFSNVPFMTGSNKNEGLYVAEIMYNDYVKHLGLEKNATYLREQFIPDILGAMGVYDDTHSIATSLQRMYCPDIDLANLTAAAPCLIDISGMLFLKSGSWQVANYHSYYSDQKTFYYSFEFESDDSLFALTGIPFDAGVTHADELMYLFSLPAVLDYPGQLDTMERMTKMWTNFAIFLDPTPELHAMELAEMGIPIWTPYNFQDHHLLVIAKNVTVEKEYSERWTIMMDEKRVNETKCTGLCADYMDERDQYKEERDQYKEERDKYKDQKVSFEATMIVFIVLTVVVSAGAIFLLLKARR